MGRRHRTRPPPPRPDGPAADGLSLPLRCVVRIPSYDDLTPSIPDVSPAEVLSEDVAPGSSDPGDSPRALYAALHGDGAIDRLITIAHDFSPRIERHPGGS